MKHDTIEIPEVLAVPILEERPWAVFAACREADPDLFFGSSKDAERGALAICEICTVAAECLEHALDARERFGVWGGKTEKERKRLQREMGW
jgi:WhiB family transcriptional regulator, redox-sensing transcriptional regulator